jgi:ABC-2 type transport system permease protein
MRVLQQVALMAFKDLRLFVLDRGALAFALAFPLLFAFAFSLILDDADLDQTATLRVATAEDSQGLSHAVIAGLREIPDIELVEMSPDEAASGDQSAYLLFPEDLTERLFSGQQALLRVVTDGSDPEDEALHRGVAFSISRDLSVRQAAIGAAVSLATQGGDVPDEARITEAVGALIQEEPDGSAGMAGIQQVQVGNIDPVPSANYVLPGYITMFLFFAAGFGAAELLRERRQHTFDRLIASGVDPSTILAGKWLGTATRALVQAIVLWSAGLLFFGINMGEAPVGTILVTLAMLVASASFALFLATIARTEQAAESIAVLAALTMAALGGSWWPLFIMPDWMQTLARVTPHAWANDAFNNLMLFGATTGDVLLNIVVLLAFGAAFALFAGMRLNVRDA